MTSILRTIAREAVVPLLALVAASPWAASASGEGEAFTLSVRGFPDRVYLGDTLRGELEVSPNDGAPESRSAVVEAYVDTPLGRAVLSRHAVRLSPDEPTVIHVSFPIADDAPTGRCVVGFEVRVGGDVLEVEREVDIVGGK
jgi:hypothetical protein